MVSTRSSARKHPITSRPSSSPARLTSHHSPVPVLDDSPPTHPRRSRRIKLKNGEHTSAQPASIHQSLTTTDGQVASNHNPSPPISGTPPDHQQPSSLQSAEPSSPVLSAVPVLVTQLSIENQASQHSDEEGPEEIRTATIKPYINPSHHQNPQHEIKKRRRRRQQHRQRRKKGDSPPLQTTFPSQPESQLQINTHEEGSSHPVAERLSADEIAAAQIALEHAKKRKQDAKRFARLENQVKHIGGLNKPQKIGRTEVALVSDVFPSRPRPQKKGRKPAASFLASCMQNGPKRVPASKIALMARSTNSFKT